MAEAQVAQAEAAVAALQAPDRQDDAVRAPIGGMVTSRSAHTGEAAIAGATLLTIANLDEVKLTIYVPEDELSRVYLGQEVEVRVDSFPGARLYRDRVLHLASRPSSRPRTCRPKRSG